MKQAVCIALALAFLLVGGITCTKHKVEVDVKPIKIEATIRLSSAGLKGLSRVRTSALSR